MKSCRFWMGSAYGMFTSYALDQIEWASWVKIAVFLALFFVAQYIAHELAES